MKSTVHKYKGVWWFWDKKKRRRGSYLSRWAATVGFQVEIKEEKENENDVTKRTLSK